MFSKKRTSTFFSSFFHLLWPRICCNCGQAIIHHINHCFCPDCFATILPIELQLACSVCANPFLNEINPLAPEKICLDCRRLSPSFTQIFAVYEYGGAITKALYQFKWKNHDDLAKPLGRLLSPLLSQVAKDYDMIIPVPLHISRLIERGYNQAALLSKFACHFAQVSIPIQNRLFIRNQKTESTQNKDPNERILQTEKAFCVLTSQTKKILNQKILLVDDVVTTGATIQACSLALLQAGASSVSALALCRATSYQQGQINGVGI